MEKVRELLGRRFFGVPGYVIAVVAVTLLALVAWKMKPSAPETSDEAVEDESAGGDPEPVTNPVFLANPAPTVVSGDGDGESSATNEQWARRAIEWLISRGTPEELARPTIQRYLAGEILTTQQNGLKNQAIAQFGLPPEMVSGGGVAENVNTGTTAPARKQGPLPRKHKVMGTADDTNRELARLYYGRDDSVAVALIASRNLFNPTGKWKIGDSVTIPEYRGAVYKVARRGMQTADEFGAKNATTGARIIALNPGKRFPVKIGTRVRVR